MIAFGLLDSHTTTAMTNARLDHYVYTVESITHARTLAEPGRGHGPELRGPNGRSSPTDGRER